MSSGQQIFNTHFDQGSLLQVYKIVGMQAYFYRRLQLALPALDEVDDIPPFASYRCLYMEGTASGIACESVFSQDV